MNSYALEQFKAEVGNPVNLAALLDLYGRLTPDFLLEAWAGKIASRAEQGIPYWDLAAALRQLAHGLRPSTYLEIGIRRGKSMAMVAGTCPDAAIYGFDLWMTPYGGAENPGPDFVRSEMLRLGHAGPLTLTSGDSRQTVPAFAAANPGVRFDLINVDGDHSDEGAWADLVTVAELVSPGGYIVFDDLMHPAHTLLGVYRHFEQEYGDRFEFAENLADHNGTSVFRRR
jgi:predicted O-methyltransferase YrrM